MHLTHISVLILEKKGSRFSLKCSIALQSSSLHHMYSIMAQSVYTHVCEINRHYIQTESVLRKLSFHAMTSHTCVHVCFAYSCSSEVSSRKGSTDNQVSSPLLVNFLQWMKSEITLSYHRERVNDSQGHEL